tara:strand:- start:471 stop:662 length:192 start_codon:yes stop_codon:yes gene_type:complete
MKNVNNGESNTWKMELERFKLIGSIHLLPFVSVCYESDKCERAVTIGWLFWAFAIVKKNGMHL